MILSQFDPEKRALINPSDIVTSLPQFPKTVVTCFARTTFARILVEVPHRQIAKTSMANLEIPVYELDFHGEKSAFLTPTSGQVAALLS